MGWGVSVGRKIEKRMMRKEGRDGGLFFQGTERRREGFSGEL